MSMNGPTEHSASNEPLMRPFEIVAIACGILTLIGTFAVSHVLLKGLLIGGSLVILVGSLLYFGLSGSRQDLPQLLPVRGVRRAGMARGS